MKNKLLIIAVAVSLSACKKDFLNLVPQTSLSSASFFTTQAQFQQALNATYTPLRVIVNAGFYMDEMRSDNTFLPFTRPTEVSKGTEKHMLNS